MSPAGVDSSRDRDPLRWFEPGLDPLVWCSADRRGQLGVDQFLHPVLQQPAEQLLGSPSPSRATASGNSGIIVMGHRVNTFLERVLRRSHQGSRDGPPDRWTLALPTPPHGTPTQGSPISVVGAADDPLEQEADAVAAIVMSPLGAGHCDVVEAGPPGGSAGRRPAPHAGSGAGPTSGPDQPVDDPRRTPRLSTQAGPAGRISRSTTPGGRLDFDSW